MKRIARLNRKLAVWVVGGVGSMWCAYLFALLACVSLPEALRGGVGPLVQWVSTTFLQLVLLSIIMVGGNVLNEKSEKQAAEDHRMIKDEFAALKLIHEDIRLDLAANAELLQLLREDVANDKKMMEKLDHLDGEIENLLP